MLDALNAVLGNAYKTAEFDANLTKAAPTGVSLIGSGIGDVGIYGGVSEASAAKEHYRHYSGRVFSAIRVIAERISGQPVIVARVGKPTSKSRSLLSYIRKGMLRRCDIDHRLKRYTFDEVEIVSDHRLLDVLDDPNELMLSSTLWLVSVANLLVTGRCLWVVNPDPKDPEIMPIPTTWATPVHDQKNGKLYARWQIKPPNSTDDPMIVDGEFVANFYFPDPEDPFGCISPLAMQGEAVLTDEAITTAQRVAFRNEINPTTAIYVGEAATGDGKRQMKLTPEQRKQLITWIRQEHAGAKKFGVPMILDAIIRDIKILGNKPKEIGFIESADQTQKQIFMGFGVPLSSAGITEGTNYASSAVADHTLCTNSVNPIMKLFSEGITAWVLPLFNTGKQKMRAWLVPAEAYDPDMQIRRWTAARQAYAVSRNNIRTELLGIPEIDGLDDVVVPNTFQSVKLGQPIVPAANPGSGAVSNDNGPPTDVADTENMREERKAFRKTYKTTWVKTQAEEEGKLRKDVEAFLRGQVRSIVISMRGMEDRHVSDADSLVSEILPSVHWDELLFNAVRPTIRKQIVRGRLMTSAASERHVGYFSKVLVDLSPSMTQHIQFSIDDALSGLVDNGKWKNVNDETRRQLSFTIQEGLTEGDTLRELADRIEREMGPEWSGARALKIARTESSSGLNAGHYLAQQELEEEGIAYGQEWLSIIDEDTRIDHVQADGQKVASGQLFDVGGYPARYPGDPNLPAEERVNCRCTSVPVFEPIEDLSVPARSHNRLNGFHRNGKSVAGCC